MNETNPIKPKILIFIGHYFPGYEAGGPLRAISNMVDNIKIGGVFISVELATQYIDTSFSLTSFPSKILTYLSAGLQPVCATSSPVNLWEHKRILYIYNEKHLSDLVGYVKSYNKHDHKEVRKLMIETQKSIRGELLEALK